MEGACSVKLNNMNYNLDLIISFPKIDFDSTWEEIYEKTNCQFTSNLLVDNNQIALTIHFDKGTGFGTKLIYWLEKNGFEKFGRHIKAEITSSSNINKIIFSEAEIMTSNLKSDFIVLYLSSIRIEEETSTINETYANFYLNEVGDSLTNRFYSDFQIVDDFLNFKHLNKDFFKISNYEYRPEFELQIIEQNTKVLKIGKVPKLHFKNITGASNEILNCVKIICDGISFYGKAYLYYDKAVIQLKGKRIYIKNIIKPLPLKPWFNLFLVGNKMDIFEFLRNDWASKIASKKDYLKFSTIVSKFLQALILDDRNKFLIQYSILEILRGGKDGNEKEKFECIVDDKEKEKILTQSFEIILKCVDIKDHEDIKSKWKYHKDKIFERPSKRNIQDFLSQNSIHQEKFPSKFSTNKIVKMRDNIAHGSIRKVKEGELKQMNKILLRINTILILNYLEIDEWVFDISDIK